MYTNIIERMQKGWKEERKGKNLYNLYRNIFINPIIDIYVDIVDTYLRVKAINSDPIRAWKCNFLPF